MTLGSRLWLRIPDYTLLLCLEFWPWTLMLTTQAAFWPEELTKLLRFSIRMTNRFVFLIKFDFGLEYFEKVRENAMLDNDYCIMAGFFAGKRIVDWKLLYDAYLQVILNEIDCAIFYTKLHELFSQFIS